MSSPNSQSGSMVLHDGRTCLPKKRSPLALYTVDSPAGPAWLGIHNGKIVWMSIGDLDQQSVAAYWKGDVVMEKDGPISSGDLVEAVQGERRLDLAPEGTEFQQKVWAALMRIPFSATLSYGQLAEDIGSPKSARAVGAAVGANPIAWLIPCHRILPSTGGLGGYRWGRGIKESLLSWEGKRHPSGAPGQIMEDKRKLEAMLLNAQRFEDTAKMAGDIAHDLNNLLAPIRMATELLKRKLEDPSVDRYVEIIDTSTERARSVIQEILSYSRESEVIEPAVIDVNPLLQELEEMVAETFPEHIKLLFEYQKEAPMVKLDPHQLHRSILNLLVNARDAIQGGGQIHVQVSIRDVDIQISVGERCLVPGRYTCISVSDTGSGIKPEIREQIFAPFFTTKPKEKGTGLGLASVFGIIARAGGFIDVESVEGEGATFHVYLPEASSEAD